MFIENYKTILEECQDKKKYIWKDQICDGKNDCLDASDERNCSKCTAFFLFLTELFC